MKVMPSSETNGLLPRGAAGHLHVDMAFENFNIPTGSNDNPAIAAVANSDDFSREVYGILGIPVDVIDMSTALQKIEAAAASNSPFLLSTPNLNFLAISQHDAEFRESLLISDLCPADGMPIVWLARLLGVPIKERIAGSDIFETLKSARFAIRRLSVFLFGGAAGVASAAASRLNAQSCGVVCAGSFNPGFDHIDAMSTDAIIDVVNSSKADFLVAALSAKKGQGWLVKNHHRLSIPVRCHLGAVLNIEAGMVQRAHASLRRSGLEWLWRIKEEPYLWRRYWNDGWVFLHLLLTRALPIAIGLRWQRMGSRDRSIQALSIQQMEDSETITLRLSGDAIDRHIDSAVSSFRKVVKTRKNVDLDLSATRVVDVRFVGLLLMLRKQLHRHGNQLNFVGITPTISRLLRLNGFGFLLCTSNDSALPSCR